MSHKPRGLQMHVHKLPQLIFFFFFQWLHLRRHKYPLIFVLANIISWFQKVRTPPLGSALISLCQTQQVNTFFKDIFQVVPCVCVCVYIRQLPHIWPGNIFRTPQNLLNPIISAKYLPENFLGGSFKKFGCVRGTQTNGKTWKLYYSNI